MVVYGVGTRRYIGNNSLRSNSSIDGSDVKDVVNDRYLKAGGSRRTTEAEVGIPLLNNETCKTPNLSRLQTLIQASVMPTT